MLNDKNIKEDAEMWFYGFNEIPKELIEKYYSKNNYEELEEITLITPGDTVNVHELQDEYEVKDIDRELGNVTVSTEDGDVTISENDVDKVEFEKMPLGKKMWTFKDPSDIEWLEVYRGIEEMSELGFRIYSNYENWYLFGIDDSDYMFMERYIIPLYCARFLQ